MMCDELDLNLFRPIECSFLDNAVDEYLDAEADQLSGIGESAGIDGMLDDAIDSICEAEGITFNEMLKIHDSNPKYADLDVISEEDDEDEEEDDEEYSTVSDDDYTSYNDVEAEDDDDEDEEEED